MYAYFNNLVYFSTECIYAPNAYRGHARAFLKDLEKIRSSSIIDVIHSGKNIFLVVLLSNCNINLLYNVKITKIANIIYWAY